MKQRNILLISIVLIALSLVTGFALATKTMAGLQPANNYDSASVDASVPAAIFYQGRLVDDLGDPVIDNTYVMTFSLYTQASGGTAIDVDGHTVQVAGGLFRTYMNFNPAYYNGQALFVGVQVAGDAEMAPRHYLRPVPYALSLRPGAVISGEVTASQPALTVVNTGPGNAIRGYKDGTGAAVAGVNDGAGPGGYFESAGGPALWVEGDLFVNGSVWAKSYENVIVVAKGNSGDFNSIQAALDSITDAAEDNPYLVRVMPGKYEEKVTLKPYVTVDGSGPKLTVISYATGVSSNQYEEGVVKGASNSVLSNLRVVSLLVNPSPPENHAVAISARGIDYFTIDNVIAQASGSGGSVGLYAQSADFMIKNSIITGVGGEKVYGIYGYGNVFLNIMNSAISVSGGDAKAYGIYAARGSGISLTGCTVSAKDTDQSYSLYGDLSYYEINNSKLIAGGGISETVGIKLSNGEVNANGSTIESWQGGENLGIYADGSWVTVENGSISVGGDMKSTAVFADDQSEITLINNTTVATSTSSVYPTWGLMLQGGSSATIRFSDISVSGGANAFGIENQGDAETSLVYTSVSATGGNTNSVGVYNSAATIPTLMTFQEGRITGDDKAIFNGDADFTVKVLGSWLEGGVNATGTFQCIMAHDGTAILNAVCQ